MGDKHQQDEPEDPDTGPQGTRVFRREDIDRHFSELESRATDSGGRYSGAAFVGTTGSFKGKRFDIPTGRSTLGRDNQNDIIVDADSVSLVHARLVEKDGRYRVLNLLSTNGTWVNNKKVSDSPLENGDTVCFGEAEFMFQQPDKQSDGLLSRLLRLFRRSA